MVHESDQPPWLPVMNRWLLRLGRTRSLLLLCALVWLLSLSISQLVISLLGRGDRLLAAACASASALIITAVLGYMFLALVAHLERSQRRMTRQATLDPLTGIFNRRHFLNLVEREWSLSRRYDTDCALVLIDVDHFKRVNDGFGHRCGDTLLCRIAEAATETLRQADVLARFGGEEFVLFLPHTDPLGALDVAERVRERIEALEFGWNGLLIPVSVSLGVAALHSEHITLDQLIRDADDALDVAKAAGRNCVRAGAGLLPGRPSVLKS
jgi:diguanylate cyclase